MNNIRGRGRGSRIAIDVKRSNRRKLWMVNLRLSIRERKAFIVVMQERGGEDQSKGKVV